MSAWDEADEHNRALLKAQGMISFRPLGPKRPAMSRKKKAEILILQGRHPFGMKLREPTGETCGSCRFLIEKHYSGTYFKCEKRGDTNGPATDVRKKWPACTAWEVMP